jgi:L-lactate dehydrogenase
LFQRRRLLPLICINAFGDHGGAAGNVTRLGRTEKERRMSRSVTIGIIGTGWVGSSVAISILQAGIANELLLADAREGLAEGEAMDLQHGSSFYPPAAVRSVAIKDMMATDAVVIAAGKNSGPRQSRLELLRDNAEVVKGIARELQDYPGIVVMVTNPVDILTYAYARFSGAAAQRVIGTGTLLDTSRLREVLGRELQLNPRSIHAQVVGEHGDSEVVLWSSAHVGGVALRQWPGWSRDREAGLTQTVRGAAYEIIRRKGATNHAIGLVTALLLRSVVRDERRVLSVSRLQGGALGIQGVALSLPAVVGSAGAVHVLEPSLDDAERSLLNHSATVLRDWQEQLAI